LLGLNKDIPALVPQEGLKHLSPVEMRMEIKRGINGSTLINDTYNSDLLSLQIDLDLLNQQNQHERQTVILSDILQSGRDEAALYREVGVVLQSKHIDRLIGIGPALQRQQQQIPVKNTIYPSTEAFLKDLPDFPFEQEAILIKGARQFRFEQITSRLQEKAHQTVLAINLQALIHNLNVYRSLLNPATRVMVMVKAFSYGSGTYEVANALQFHRADYLAVAYADEGIALRKAGITLPIMVLNPEPQAFHELVAYELEPEIYSVSLLRRFSQYLQTYHSAVSVPVHLNLDTGMHRLGIDEAALPDLLDELRSSSALRVASIFSHPAASENPAEDEFTQDQIRLYERMSEQIQGVLGYRVMRHMLNSNGIVRFPEAHYDMVRLGLGFYGIDATGQVKDRLQTPATLKTTISQIKELRPGDTVGYGRQGKVAAPMTLATIAIGYADGFSRAFGQGRGYVLINGQKAPVVGDVCMDMTMVDVTNTGAVEGDAVIVFGEEPAIEDLARWSHTIPYEILTNVSQSVKRIYLNE
jgi:alanine racemase